MFNKNIVELFFNSISKIALYSLSKPRKMFVNLIFNFKKHILTTITILSPSLHCPCHCHYHHHCYLHCHYFTTVISSLSSPLCSRSHLHHYCLHHSTITAIITICLSPPPIPSPLSSSLSLFHPTNQCCHHHHYHSTIVIVTTTVIVATIVISLLLLSPLCHINCYYRCIVTISSHHHP